MPVDPTARGFDRLSPVYDGLVALFPGRAIPRSQLLFLDRAADCSRALVLGGGTGGFLAALLRSRFAGNVLNLDVSSGMLRRSRDRVRRALPQALSRVEFRQGGPEALREHERFDLICTHYVLDLFDEPGLSRTVRRLEAGLEPGGLWLCSDFAAPDGGPLRRAAQKSLIGALYAFFAATCSVEPRSLPPIRECLDRSGPTRVAESRPARGLLWSACYRKRHGRIAGVDAACL